LSYFEDIKSSLKDHINILRSISLINLNDISRKKIESHLKRSVVISVVINEQIDKEEPQKLKELIEYLNDEGRYFGWSFPENEKEEMCENSFWNLKEKTKKLVGGMTGNERLYYFGYIDEFENLPSTHKSAKDEILIKLFM
jgi:hypothetical protein